MMNYRGLSIQHAQLGRACTTDNLFDPNEQVIFDFYEANRSRYKRAVDIGANVGVHSILMARQGWEVKAYEPDPTHYQMLQQNLLTHGALSVVTARAAVSDRDGRAEFVRVLGNTTGSHLAGAKQSYGPREHYDVRVMDCRLLFAWADFAKIDCEGHEAVLIDATSWKTWAHMDAMLEVGNAVNAQSIYIHLYPIVPMWAQKIGWKRVQRLKEMPERHQDGSLFIGREPPFPGM